MLENRVMGRISSVLVFVLAICVIAVRAEDIPDEAVLRNAVESIADRNFMSKTDSTFELIVSGGERAFPYLLAHFVDTRDYCSWCGYSANSNGPYVYNKKKIRRGVQVRDVCLYLVLAVYKKDIWHEETCGVEYPSEVSYQNALANISMEYMLSLKKGQCITLERILQIMHEWGVSFKNLK